MSKKNRIKKLFDRTAIEPSDTHPRRDETSRAEQHDEATPSETTPQGLDEEVTETPVSHAESTDEESPREDKTEAEITEPILADRGNESTVPESTPSEPGMAATSETEEPLLPDDSDETSAEDILEDVRRSLIEEEIDKNKKESRWWRRLGRKPKRSEPEEVPMPVEIDLPSTPEPADGINTHEQQEEAQEEPDDIDELISILEAESQAAAMTSDATTPVEETAVEPEPEIDFEELKKQAFQPRAGDEGGESFSDVRSIALEGGEEVLVEVESKAVDPMQERIGAFENALKPYRRYIYTALALLGVGMAIVASLILFNVYQQSRPQGPKEVSNLPYPTGVSLPGGWSFQLGRGILQGGKWDPGGPEWLEGTEVCRWVALPWSRQLEAVVRTLNPKDPIELVMSNNDTLTYETYSVRELTMEEIQAQDSSSPCLLLILTQSDSDKHWVLTALP